MNDILVGVGNRLREYRKSKGLTQAEVADILEMSLNFYGGIERGKSRLSIEKMILAHDRLGLDLTYLLTGEVQPKMSFCDIISDCPKDKIFDMEQLLIYASNLYRKDDKK